MFISESIKGRPTAKIMLRDLWASTLFFGILRIRLYTLYKFVSRNKIIELILLAIFLELSVIKNLNNKHI